MWFLSISFCIYISLLQNHIFFFLFPNCVLNFSHLLRILKVMCENKHFFFLLNMFLIIFFLHQTKYKDYNATHSLWKSGNSSLPRAFHNYLKEFMSRKSPLVWKAECFIFFKFNKCWLLVTLLLIMIYHFLKLMTQDCFYIMLRAWHLPRAVGECTFLRLVNLNYVN